MVLRYGLVLRPDELRDWFFLIVTVYSSNAYHDVKLLATARGLILKKTHNL